MKNCSRCKQLKAVTEFNTTKATNGDGFQNYCKDCHSAYYKAYNASRKDAKAKVVVQSKVCRDCGLEKPISQFGKREISLDKHNIYCKPCWRKQSLIAQRKYKQNGR